jgi:hypothetical protein
MIHVVSTVPQNGEATTVRVSPGRVHPYLAVALMAFESLRIHHRLLLDEFHEAFQVTKRSCCRFMQTCARYAGLVQITG